MCFWPALSSEVPFLTMGRSTVEYRSEMNAMFHRNEFEMAVA